MFSGYNRKVATTTCPCPIQLLRYISRMMEPPSHYHCEVYWCKPVPINLHQTTWTMHQPVPQPIINIYHKKLHQPCTNLYQTTLERIVKIIYPPLNFGLLYFTFPLKFGLDILWLPQSPIDIQYAQVWYQMREPCLLFIVSKYLP